MGLFADYFGGFYSSYKAYFDNRSERKYVYVLVNNDLSTQEILKFNPGGTKEIGLVFARSEKYHGINTSLTLEITFSKDTYKGGNFLVTAFDNKATRADVDCYVYKLNPNTGDFDLFYEGKVDFSPESYTHRPNDREVRATLHETGLQNRFLTRETIKLDISKNKAIDGTTVSSIASGAITFKAVDIYLICNAEQGQIVQLVNFLSTGNNTAYYSGGSESINLMTNRANFETPTSGQIYVNNSGESKDVNFKTEYGYFYQSNVPAGGAMTTYVRYYVYNSGGGVVNANTLLTITNNAEGIKTIISDDDFESGYITVPDGGYCAYFVYTTYTGANPASINFTQQSTRIHSLDERSNSIGDTDVECYRATEVMRQLMRLYTGDNNSFNYDSGTINVYNDYVFSGFMLRGFPNKKITLSFEDVFNTCSRISPKCLIYDQDNDRYELYPISQAYQDTQILNLGKVRNLEIVPFNYFNDIDGGSAADGKYEKDQGIEEFNIRFNFTTSFEVSNKLDLRTPLNLDTIGMELTRREQYTTTGLTDTRFDKTNFYVRTTGGETEQNALFPSGFPGIDQYYNTRYNARECIINNGYLLAGLFYKDTGEAIRFASNAKDIDINYVDIVTGQKSIQEDIIQTELGTPYFYPEKITFETDMTDTQLATFRANPHGYLTIEDDDGNEYNLYVDQLETKDDKYTVEITGKLANINR